MECYKMLCQGCPNGCELEVETEEEEVCSVSGNACMKGYIYAQNEIRMGASCLLKTTDGDTV